ncbi:hypothetical protein BHAOGJBA_2940 [Methylobacterium hispanicum]|uniref:Uncharacterized protein n=1 Tax=Methylobacterium hispanicum TaxID=270350 RepID=A0AAV4ZMS2_9HYPH|nr:hypothetical protein [Methylobacterium hispanicum]GJD89413.1 hypothetical protein BHAOGJBA_2940 [Methylobacterium hispanicum]
MSSLKALEPVELRLAASFRVRREIARLTEIDAALRSEAREMTADVIGGRPEVVEVMLDVIGKPFEQEPEACAAAFGQGFVEGFLVEEHDLRLEGAPAPGSPSGAHAALGGAPPSGSPSLPPPRAAGPAAVPGQQASPPSHETGRIPQDDERPSLTEMLARRLSAYDVVMPDDFFGVTFDMLKRPEAEQIMAEATLAAVDGLTLDASPYKADRGKVHWRRRLFEEAFAHFQANPPLPIEDAVVGMDAAAIERSVEPPPAPEPARETAPAVGPVRAQEAIGSEIAPDEVRDEAASPASASGADARDDLIPEQASSLEELSAPEFPAQDPEPVRDVVFEAQEAYAGREESSDPVSQVAPENPVGEAPAAPIGRVIDFPLQVARAHEPQAEDVLDPFGAGPSLSPVRASAPIPPASDAPYDGPAADPHDETPPPYDEEDWGAPTDDAADLEREFSERIGYDRSDEEGSDADGLDAAAAAALAVVVETPATPVAAGLPTGGIPPRPAMPNLRPAPSMPPRPASAPPSMPSVGSVSPSPVAASAPPMRPSLAGGEAGMRVAPRPVAVRPPGM